MAMKSCGYDFPWNLCINKLLLHSENASYNALMMSNYADKWLEEAKGKVKSTGCWITVRIRINCFRIYYCNDDYCLSTMSVTSCNTNP